VHIRRRSGIVAALSLALLSFVVVGNVAAAGSATLRIVPSSDTVAKGANFTVRVVQNASVPTSGTSATVTFDKTKVQVQSVERGQAHKASPVFLPSDLPGAIAAANRSGQLKSIATAFLPPDNVPTGDQDFLIITFSAIGCGQVSFGLPIGTQGVDAVLIDGTEAGWGNPVPVTTKGATVSIDCSATAPTEAAATDAPAAAAAAAAAVSKGPADTANAAPAETVAGVTDPPVVNAAVVGTNGTSAGSGGSLPLWLPLLLAIPALLLIGFVLLKRPIRKPG